MGRMHRFLGYFSALVCAFGLVVSPASSRSISNTAQASWSRADTAYSTTSNTVVIETAAPPVRIETLIASPTGQAMPVFSPRCGTDPGSSPSGSANQVRLMAATNFHAGEPLYFRVSAPAANADPRAVDWIRVNLVSPAGDHEDLVIYETGPNTGEFLGYISTALARVTPSAGNCVLSAEPAQEISLLASTATSVAVIGVAQAEVLADPYGMVFDSENGAPVSGARITMLDAATGQPAKVFADDGVTRWPSVVISGEAVKDAAGRTYSFAPGEYRFPLMARGRYRLTIEPPALFKAPSVASPQQLADFARPDGLSFKVSAASSGAEFSIVDEEPVRIDIPVDPTLSPVTITKTASRQDVSPGDPVIYTITVRNAEAAHPMRAVTVVDRAASALRLRRDSVRIDGAMVADGLLPDADGSGFALNLGTLAPGTSRTITYVMTLRADAAAGTIMNEASVTDERGRSSKTGVPLRVLAEDLGSRLMLAGTVRSGTCEKRGAPIEGVRVMLEDGSFAVTDADGRYHFADLVPGSHVVRAIPATLPEGARLIDCTQSTRSAGSAQSRFIAGQGGTLAVADFVVALAQPEPAQARSTNPPAAQGGTPSGKPVEASLDEERKAAGADVNWLELGDGPTDFLFPQVGHNPRAPAVRVVIRHRVDQSITLKANGRPVDRMAFDGTNQAPGGRYAVSIWRGIPLESETTRLEAEVRDAKGARVTVLTRDVYFTQGAARFELVPDKSRLVADGQTRPVLALRVLDRNGRPLRAGSTGDFYLSAPYETAEELDSAQQNRLVRAQRGGPRWFVRGDDGIAYVELAPTMTSGKLRARFTVQNGRSSREIELETWMAPGKQPWTVIGLAEATAGAKSIADSMQRKGQFNSPLGEDGRIAVYAKGPITSDILVTAAYDSARQKDDQNLMGTVNPRSYYSVFADMSDRRFDAASRDKLYARIEGKGFVGSYGDFEAGFAQTELARYLRTATGLQGELNRGHVQLQGFAARIASLHRNDAFQGSGISGP